MNNYLKTLLLTAQLSLLASAGDEGPAIGGVDESLEAARVQLEAVVHRELEGVEQRWTNDRDLAENLRNELEASREKLTKLEQEYKRKYEDIERRIIEKEANIKQLNSEKIEHIGKLNELYVSSDARLQAMKELHEDRELAAERMMEDLRRKIREKDERLAALEGTKLRNQSYEAMVLRAAMSDTNPARRCFRYFVLFNQGTTMTTSRVEAIAKLDMSRITALSYQISPVFKSWLAEQVDKLFTRTDAESQRVREEVKDCLANLQ